MECPLNSYLGDELTVGYVARTLDAKANAAFERHIPVCSQCKNAVAAQQRVWEFLDNWQAGPVSSNFEEKVLRRLSAEPERHPLSPIGPIDARITA